MYIVTLTLNICIGRTNGNNNEGTSNNLVNMMVIVFMGGGTERVYKNITVIIIV